MSSLSRLGTTHLYLRGQVVNVRENIMRAKRIARAGWESGDGDGNFAEQNSPYVADMRFTVALGVAATASASGPAFLSIINARRSDIAGVKGGKSVIELEKVGVTRVFIALIIATLLALCREDVVDDAIARICHSPVNVPATVLQDRAGGVASITHPASLP